jgi:hypothetical protein
MPTITYQNTDKSMVDFDPTDYESREGKYPAELKPCPFCGTQPVVSVERAPMRSTHRPYVGVIVRLACEGTKCSIQPRLSAGAGTNEASKNLNREWIMKRSEDQAWRHIKRAWNKRARV